ncbi:hypothetical protein KUTeg_010029 [Tegillarca granosa]|uniref:Olfactomedin-like domain-containing protein n=1 Tax=Tegillarca granosa TaxID=220873 RepID=A0ABQ9F8U3_TEGGR|nr:hypothetical protein KUTeg_010029 [Tegillarca granosa]
MFCFSFVILLFTRYATGSVPVNADVCKFELDIVKNKIQVACPRNVTLTVQDKDGAILLTGNTLSNLWFEGDTLLRARISPSISSGFNPKSLGKLKDATTLLKRIKKKLSFQLKTLNNITQNLNEGAEQLNQDIENLRQPIPSSHLAREATIAALQNQYNFLKVAMLNQNEEMSQLISTMTTLITATQKTVRSSLAMNSKFQQEIFLVNAALTRANISHFCPRYLTRIGEDGDEISTGIAKGTVMKDPIPGGQIWVTYGYSDINEIIEYDSMTSFEHDYATKTHKLPFFCDGTGHVVYKNSLFCHKVMTDKIVKYNLLLNNWVGEMSLPGVGVHNTYPYQPGIFSDIDFAVDERGLWVVYATEASKGNIVISKLDDVELTVLETWRTNIPKKQVGNTFMICGVLYATDSFENIPTYIKYVYDTGTGGSKILTPDQIPFSNSLKKDYGQCYMLDYNPMERKLFSWNHARVEIYPVFTRNDDEG